VNAFKAVELLPEELEASQMQRSCVDTVCIHGYQKPFLLQAAAKVGVDSPGVTAAKVEKGSSRSPDGLRAT